MTDRKHWPIKIYRFQNKQTKAFIEGGLSALGVLSLIVLSIGIGVAIVAVINLLASQIPVKYVVCIYIFLVMLFIFCLGGFLALDLDAD